MAPGVQMSDNPDHRITCTPTQEHPPHGVTTHPNSRPSSPPEIGRLVMAVVLLLLGQLLAVASGWYLCRAYYLATGPLRMSARWLIDPRGMRRETSFLATGCCLGLLLMGAGCCLAWPWFRRR
jgi:hypothetical protein